MVNWERFNLAGDRDRILTQSLFKEVRFYNPCFLIDLLQTKNTHAEDIFSCKIWTKILAVCLSCNRVCLVYSCTRNPDTFTLVCYTIVTTY